jgi:hypothetical protein
MVRSLPRAATLHCSIKRRRMKRPDGSSSSQSFALYPACRHILLTGHIVQPGHWAQFRLIGFPSRLTCRTKQRMRWARMIVNMAHLCWRLHRRPSSVSRWPASKRPLSKLRFIASRAFRAYPYLLMCTIALRTIQATINGSPWFWTVSNSKGSSPRSSPAASSVAT